MGRANLPAEISPLSKMKLYPRLARANLPAEISPLSKMKLYPAFLLLLLAWSANSSPFYMCRSGSECDGSSMGPTKLSNGVRYCCNAGSTMHVNGVDWEDRKECTCQAKIG